MEASHFVTQEKDFESRREKAARDRTKKDRTVFHYVKRRLALWYEIDGEVPSAIIAAREQRDRYQQQETLQEEEHQQRRRRRGEEQENRSFQQSTQREPNKKKELFEALHGILRSAPKQRPLTKRQRRAFAPSVAKCQNVRAAANGVVERAVELHFGRAVFVTFVTLSGKIHDTVEVDDDLDDEERNELRYRDGRVVDDRQKRKKVFLGLDGTDAYCERVAIEALDLKGGCWMSLGDFGGPPSGPAEIARSLGDCCHASLRDGVKGVACTGLRFRAITWRRSPALRVGAYGSDLSLGQSRPRQTSPTLPQDDAVVYQLRYTAQPTALDDPRADARSKLFLKYALKPRRTSAYDYYGDKTSRQKKHLEFARHIKAAIDDDDDPHNY